MASLLESTICGLNMGKGNGSNNQNTIFGKCAGNSFTSGNYNSAIGFCAGRATCGSHNVSLGYKAGFAASCGCYNVFVGGLAGATSYNGSHSVIVGQNAGYFTSCCSVGIGNQAFRTGCPERSVALGKTSLCNSALDSTAIGVEASKTSSCALMVSVGWRAGGSTGGDCTVNIGAMAGFYNNPTNGVNIGFNIYTAYGNNRFILGKYGNSNAYVWSNWQNVSDSRDKIEINELPNNLGLNFIRKLRPVSFKYDYRKEYMFKCGFEHGIKDGTLKKSELNYGFLAQEIKQSADELNISFDAVSYDKYSDEYSLKIIELLAPIIKSIQELNIELDNIEKQI